MPAGAGGSLHPPPAGHASARPVPGAGKRGLRRPEGPRRAGGQVLVLSLRQKWRERPAAPTEGRGAGRGWRSGCVESEAAAQTRGASQKAGQNPSPAQPAWFPPVCRQRSGREVRPDDFGRAPGAGRVGSSGFAVLTNAPA